MSRIDFPLFTLCWLVVFVLPIHAQPIPEGTAESFAEKKALLELEVERARAAVDQWGANIADFDAEFERQKTVHPTREIYDRAQADGAVYLNQIVAIDGDIARNQQAIVYAEGVTTTNLARLGRQQEQELFALRNSYEQRRSKAPPEEIAEIDAAYRNEVSLVQIKYELAAQEARRLYSQERAQKELRINELIDQKTYITNDKLAAIMADAQPYIAFVEEGNNRRQALVAQLNVLKKELTKAQNRARGLALPKAEDDVATQKVRIALALMSTNPQKAKERLADVIEDFPDSSAANRAKAQLANLNDGKVSLSQRLELRQWTALAGDYQVEARLAGFKKGEVHLQKPDGALLKVALERFSEADQQYVLDLYKE